MATAHSVPFDVPMSWLFSGNNGKVKQQHTPCPLYRCHGLSNQKATRTSDSGAASSSGAGYTAPPQKSHGKAAKRRIMQYRRLLGEDRQELVAWWAGRTMLKYVLKLAAARYMTNRLAFALDDIQMDRARMQDKESYWQLLFERSHRVEYKKKDKKRRTIKRKLKGERERESEEAKEAKQVA